MAVTQGSPAVGNLVAQLTSQLESGLPGARASFGGEDNAFAWSSGLPRGLWSFVTTASVSGSGFNALLVSPSATPVAPVGEGQPKPSAVAITPKTFSLIKYAGIATFSFELAQASDVLPQAVTQTLVNGALVALEGSAIAALDADAGESVAGDSWTAAILNGIAAVSGNGGSPEVLVISAADLATAVTQPTQLAFAGSDPVLTYLGLKLHVSPKAAAGTAFVLDAGSTIVAEHEASPVAVIDAYSQADTNQIRLVVDVSAVTAVVNPGLVAKVVPVIVP